MDNYYYLLIKNIKIEGANAISSPLTYGFPAISGFVGAVHQLSRKIKNKSYIKDENVFIYFDGVSISCNSFQLHTYENYFKQKRQILDKQGKNQSIIQEGFMDLDVNLILKMHLKNDNKSLLTDKLKNEQSENYTNIIKDVKNLLLSQRLVGGNIVNIGEIDIFSPSELNKIASKIRPSFVLVESHKDMEEILFEMQTGYEGFYNEYKEKVQYKLDENEERIKSSLYVKNENANKLDVILEMARIYINNEEFTSVKKNRGYIVPMPIGFQKIKQDKVNNQFARKFNNYDSYYVETIYSLCKYKFPTEDVLKNSFWYYQKTDNEYLFQCKN